MKTLKIALLLAVAICSSSIINAQNSEGINREIGLRMGGLSDFNFIYKKEIKENKFLRVRAGSFNARVSGITNHTSLGLNLAMGIENRKPLDDKLSFIHGFEPRIATQAAFSSRNSIIANLGLGYVLGFNVDVSDKLGLNIEAIPALNFTYSKLENSDAEGELGLNFNSNAVALTAVYRFNK